MAEVQSIDPHSPTPLPDGRVLHYRDTATDVDAADPEVQVALEAGKLRVIGEDFDVAGSKVDDVLDWVGDDTGRAAYALTAEQSAQDPRKTLVGKLQELVDPDTTDVNEGAQQ